MRDRFGREIREGDTVVFAARAGLMEGKVCDVASFAVRVVFTALEVRRVRIFTDEKTIAIAETGE